jgi:dipeptide/tripeptide permease
MESNTKLRLSVVLAITACTAHGTILDILRERTLQAYFNSPEKLYLLIVLQLQQKFDFHGVQKFITLFTTDLQFRILHLVTIFLTNCSTVYYEKVVCQHVT